MKAEGGLTVPIHGGSNRLALMMKYFKSNDSDISSDVKLKLNHNENLEPGLYVLRGLLQNPQSPKAAQ